MNQNPGFWDCSYFCDFSIVINNIIIKLLNYMSRQSMCWILLPCQRRTCVGNRISETYLTSSWSHCHYWCCSHGMTQIFRCLRHHQLAGTKYFTLIVNSQLIPLDAFLCSEYIRYYTIVSCDQTIGKEYVVLPADSFSCSVCWPAWKSAHSEIMLIHLAHLHKIFLMSQPIRPQLSSDQNFETAANCFVLNSW